MSTATATAARDRLWLIEQSANVLEDGGFDQLTVERLSRRLHISKSTLYKHFQRKAEVVEEIVDRVCDATEAELDEAQTAEDVVDVVARHLERLPRALLVEPHRLSTRSRERLSLVRFALRARLRRTLELDPQEAPRSPAMLSAAFVAACEAAATELAPISTREGRAAGIKHVAVMFGIT